MIEVRMGPEEALRLLAKAVGLPLGAASVVECSWWGKGADGEVELKEPFTKVVMKFGAGG